MAVNGEVFIFEPYPFEERRGVTGRWRVGCQECGRQEVARMCDCCRRFLCWDCNAQWVNEHLRWLYARARSRLVDNVQTDS